jgi:DcmR-like sensory protein/histidine kinase-like protein
VSARTPAAAAVPQHHVVTFYGQDRELVQAVGGFLADALVGGGVAVVVATGEHRKALEEWLAGSGVDAGSAEASGAYLALDAGRTVARFLRDGRPDAAGFDSVVGQVIREAAQSGQPVHVYGEMVSLLWAAGLVNAALELETLWNALAAEVPFSLFCSYPAHAVTSSTHRDALSEVCRLHGGVLGTTEGPASGRIESSASFPSGYGSPRAARRFVCEALAQWGAVGAIDDAAIVVTELANNAVLHAHTGFVVTLSCDGGDLRICVEDAAPLTEGSPPAAEPGHGLAVVAAVSRRWRAEDTGSGKAVWADLQT